MSAQGSMLVIAVAAMVLFGVANAANIRVGGAAGWSLSMGGWPNGKTFKAGDVLEFDYNPAFHNVVIVSKENFDSCTPKGTTLRTGHDLVKLNSGTSYCICGLPGHCVGGMKAAVTAV